jgi:hypothetical protein
MSIIRKEGEHYVFVNGKHKGETLDEVAGEDPSYVEWVHREASDDLGKEAIQAIEGVMEENGIEPT